PLTAAEGIAQVAEASDVETDAPLPDEPLLDPAVAKSVASEAETMRRAAESALAAVGFGLSTDPGPRGPSLGLPPPGSRRTLVWSCQHPTKTLAPLPSPPG